MKTTPTALNSLSPSWLASRPATVWYSGWAGGTGSRPSAVVSASVRLRDQLAYGVQSPAR